MAVFRAVFLAGRFADFRPPPLAAFLVPRFAAFAVLRLAVFFAAFLGVRVAAFLAVFFPPALRLGASARLGSLAEEELELG